MRDLNIFWIIVILFISFWVASYVSLILDLWKAYKNQDVYKTFAEYIQYVYDKLNKL